MQSQIKLDEIHRLRSRIDEIDGELTLLLKARYETARLLGRIKAARRVSLRDLRRESFILTELNRRSTEMGLDPATMERIFREIFRLSVKAQQNSNLRSGISLRGLRLLVIGGTGRMGRFLAGYASLQGARVRIAGRSMSKTRRVARELEVESGTVPDAATSDIVIVSVPIEDTERVSTSTASFMKDGSLLSDVSSVKTGISDRIANHTRRKIEYVSIHPLFGPDVDHLFGEDIAVVAHRPGPFWATLRRTFEASGANIYPITATMHDRRMAHVQGLHHFALMTLGVALSSMGGAPKTRSLRSTESRISKMIENWDTVQRIQTMNPFVPELRQKFGNISREYRHMTRPQGVSLREQLSLNVQKWTRK